MAGHVYLIGSRRYGWYKIGKSSNATIRVSELGILLPFRIEVVSVWKSESHHALERFLHEKYAGERINGEWFLFNGQRLMHVISEIDSLRLVNGQVAGLENYSNLLNDSAHTPRAFDKKIDKLFARAKKAEERVEELEALIKSMEMPKI